MNTPSKPKEPPATLPTCEYPFQQVCSDYFSLEDDMSPGKDRLSVSQDQGVARGRDLFMVQATEVLHKKPA